MLAGSGVNNLPSASREVVGGSGSINFDLAGIVVGGEFFNGKKRVGAFNGNRNYDIAADAPMGVLGVDKFRRVVGGDGNDQYVGLINLIN